MISSHQNFIKTTFLYPISNITLRPYLNNKPLVESLRGTVTPKSPSFVSFHMAILNLGRCQQVFNPHISLLHDPYITFQQRHFTGRLNLSLLLPGRHMCRSCHCCTSALRHQRTLMKTIKNGKTGKQREKEKRQQK